MSVLAEISFLPKKFSQLGHSGNACAKNSVAQKHLPGALQVRLRREITHTSSGWRLLTALRALKNIFTEVSFLPDS